MPDRSAPADATLHVLRELAAGPGRESALRLLAGGSRREPYLRACCDGGQVFGFAGVALLSVAHHRARRAELVAVADDTASGADGIAAEMLGRFADLLRARGFERIEAPVAEVDVGLMRTLVDARFRFVGVERDGCTPDRGFETEGDLVWFELEL